LSKFVTIATEVANRANLSVYVIMTRKDVPGHELDISDILE